MLELDGELLEAVKLSWGNIGCSSCILTCLQRASTFNHCQRAVLCTEPLWKFFCFYVSSYGLCEREKVCPHVVIPGK